MKATLIGAEHEENLSLRYLAASLRQAGVPSDLLAFNDYKEIHPIAGRVVEHSPELVGLSIAFQHRARDFMKLATLLRQKGYSGHITCGGHLPTILHERILQDCPAIDSVVRHDGEETIKALAMALDKGLGPAGIEGLTYRKGAAIVANPPRRQPDPIDSLPFPVREGREFSYLGVPFATLVGSRGCHNDCAFCCIAAWHRSSLGRVLRLRGEGSIAREMALLRAERGIRVFCFHDDNFFLPLREDTRKRFESLASAFEREGLDDIGLMVKCRPDNLDRDLLLLARDRLGLFRVYIGIENGSTAGLLHLNRHTTVEQNHRSLELLREAGIYACYNLMIYEPDTSMADIGENLAFMEDHLYFPFNFGRTEVYCGTRLETRLREEGRLEGSYLSYNYLMRDPKVELLFRITNVAFQKRNFGQESLANLNVHLGFELRLLGHFHPPLPEGLAEQGENLTRQINYDTLCFLREAYGFTDTVDVLDRRKVNEFVLDLTYRINTRDHFLKQELREFQRRMKYHAFARR